MEPPGDPKGSPGGFSVSKNFDTLLKNAGIFSRGCRLSRALAYARTRQSLSRETSEAQVLGCF